MARTPDLAKYPLRVHIIAADRTDRVERMKPGESVVCDAIDDMTSSISPGGGGAVTLSGVFSDPCTFGATEVVGRQLEINNGYVYSGEGRADVVAPPRTTQGVSFRYRNCGRVRVLPGFQSLPARWKRPGQLEVLLPSDEIPVNGREPRPERCTLTATLHDFVYLLLRNGAVFQVTQEVYWKNPALRAFLRGNPETVEQRVKEFTVAVPRAR
ncbi:MAG TPA: hypothetical protein VII58_11270 [Acidobacteriaceae bacterium]